MGTGGRPGAPAPADTTNVVEFLERALHENPEGGLVITVPAPVTRPERILDDAGPGVFWTTPGAPVHAGVGAAHTITATGADRFLRVHDDAQALWNRLTVVAHPTTTPVRPRLFGGFAFLPGPPSAPWHSFGDTTFILPRLLYTVDPEGRARLSITINDDERAAPDSDRLIHAARAILARLGEASESAGAGSSPGPADPAGSDRPDDAPDRAEWARAVASIQHRIETGRADKIVAARSRDIPLPDAGDIGAMLRRMELESATAARFAFRLGADVFLGATPERLVGRHGDEVRTEALAGSVAADSSQRDERLLKSLKEEVEHDYVVRAIVEALEPLCESLDYPAEPRVKRLRHVLHLQTPFVGRLRSTVHVLELVERMHPTPAVGGWPRAEALEWIDREEPGSRGWYAAPVGWFDDRGDGEFGVALRSALLHEGRAHLFAGAGIVRGSNADAEYDETEVKLRTMLDALGASS